MIKKVICIIGGVISIIATFLPVFTITYTHFFEDVTIYYWIFGQMLLQEKGEADELYFWSLDVLGTIFMMIIITGAMLVIMNADEDSKPGLIKGLIGGLIVILAMVAYTEAIHFALFNNYSSRFIRYLLEDDDYEKYYQITVSYGYYTALIGGLISIGGSFIPNKKSMSYDGG